MNIQVQLPHGSNGFYLLFNGFDFQSQLETCIYDMFFLTQISQRYLKVNMAKTEFMIYSPNSWVLSSFPIPENMALQLRNQTISFPSPQLPTHTQSIPGILIFLFTYFLNLSSFQAVVYDQPILICLISTLYYYNSLLTRQPSSALSPIHAAGRMIFYYAPHNQHKMLH